MPSRNPARMKMSSRSRPVKLKLLQFIANWRTNWSLYNIDNELSFSEKHNCLMHIASIKNSCSSVCLNETKIPPTEGSTEKKLSCYIDKILRPTTEIISQRYNRLHQLYRKNKTSERGDIRFNERKTWHWYLSEHSSW